jgi:hypothetical protein
MDGGGLAVIGRLEDGDWRTRAFDELAVAVRGNLPDLEDVDLPLVDASPVAAARASVSAMAGVRTPDPGRAVSDSAGASTGAPRSPSHDQAGGVSPLAGLLSVLAVVVLAGTTVLPTGDPRFSRRRRGRAR